ncbi:hypothetical protein HH310_09880 [Actinoplanes sp. TBRC 11911]|uniref:nuclear transport factor 2 family protein n=1 Tax=Actinoplanes sp. TBRC 11911 TaxID=2729386 RepID=UPI00145F8824|nr:nuclear transport factor 2 family protein [Actinoplanes sp. TBRC 11911]NMO51498.1 hypothetical protein [Actinoplanes sp. TBRC 11911]
MNALATPELRQLMDGLFEAKSQGVSGANDFVGYFAPEKANYLDATMGWRLGADPARARELFATWKEGAHSYATRTLGDTDGAIVFMVDSAEMFGAEIRTISSVDFEDGKIVRWVDYWSGRTWPAGLLKDLSVPADQWPADLAEATVEERADPAMRQIVTELAAALADGDADRAATLMSGDVEFDDLALNVHLTGRQPVHSFLHKALPLIPYGRGLSIRHVVGGRRGGGFEWTAAGRALPGITALELDDDGRIARMTSTWDGGARDTDALVTLYRLTLV